MILETITVLLILLLVYTWIGYPVLLTLVAKRRPTREGPKAGRIAVDILLAAYNEEDCIGDRLQNLMEAVNETTTPLLQHSSTPTRIWLGIDGSSDRTAEIAREFAARHSNIHVCEFVERRGKVAVLKDLVTESEESSAEAAEERVLVFTDANTVFRTGALEKLLGHFADSKMGGVCGRLELTCARNPSPGEKNPLSLWERAGVRGPQGPTRGNPEGVYWRWENWLKQKESDLDSCLGANGAIYAIRRELFPQDLPDNTIVDDFVIGMKVREQGLRMVYESEAVAEEDVPDRSDEWHRRVRIGAGDYQALWLCRRCLAPGHTKLAWMFWSHKVLRWFTPQMLLALFVASWALAWRGGETGGMGIPRGLPLIVMSIAIGAGFVGAATAGLRLAVFRPFVLSDHFLTMQAAMFVGFIRFCRGGLKGAWQRTPRGG